MCTSVLTVICKSSDPLTWSTHKFQIFRFCIVSRKMYTARLIFLRYAENACRFPSIHLICILFINQYVKSCPLYHLGKCACKTRNQWRLKLYAQLCVCYLVNGVISIPNVQMTSNLTMTSYYINAVMRQRLAC